MNNFINNAKQSINVSLNAHKHITHQWQNLIYNINKVNKYLTTHT